MPARRAFTRSRVNRDIRHFGRFGGDEFMVPCPGQTAPQALILADTLRPAVATRAPLADPPIPGLTLSLGVVQADPEQGYEVDDLFVRADAALYLAKQRGHNACVAADDETVAQAVPGRCAGIFDRAIGLRRLPAPVACRAAHCRRTGFRG